MCKITGVELYKLTNNNHINYHEYESMEEANSSSPYSTTPFKADIKLDELIVHFKGDEYSFARTYSYKQIYPAKRTENGKTEVIERRCYMLTFNNPHDAENPVSRVVVLTCLQNLKFGIFRGWRWIRKKENLLWITNIIILILNIVALFRK